MTPPGRTSIAAALFAVAGIACAVDGASGAAPISYERSEFMVAMHDGVRLSTDIYRPVGWQNQARWPAVLWRSVYDKESVYGNEPYLSQILDHGYFVVVQNTRGRGASEGRFVPSVGDRKDGHDTISWIVAQPWSDGKVGTAGCSSLGEAQLLTAAAGHPNHLAMIPQSAASGYNVRGRPWAAFDGGVFELAQTAGWFSGDPARIDYHTLPVVDVLRKAGLPPSEYEKFASSNPQGDYFRQLEWLVPGEQLDVPALFFDSWYDYGPAETLELFNSLTRNALSERARENQFAIIFPYTHCGYLNPDHGNLVGTRDLGDARRDVGDLMLRWYDYWLRGIDNGVTDMPRVQYYVMGRNRWQSAPAWPVPGTRFERLYLGSLHGANGLQGDGTLSWALPAGADRDSFVYDPGSPVPSLGGHVCCTGKDTEAGAYDQARIEMREDVLVYTSPVLDQALEVTGPLEVVLHVSSSAPDTDFMAKLVDVYPDGRAFNVQEGALRMRYREGFDQDLRMTAGAVYRIRLDLHVTSNYFDVDHRIRLEVTSSNFPRWDRNLNTGGDNFSETDYHAAMNTVHHSTEYPSWILLPIVP
jgi:predicted acyl esterase